MCINERYYQSGRRYIESSRLSLFILNADGTITYANEFVIKDMDNYDYYVGLRGIFIDNNIYVMTGEYINAFDLDNNYNRLYLDYVKYNCVEL